MILGTKIICVSIGDGGCFLVKSGIVTPAFAEDEDEPVANITYSLCQDDAFSHLLVSVHELSAYDGAVILPPSRKGFKTIGVWYPSFL